MDNNAHRNRMFIEQRGRCSICDGHMTQDKSISLGLFASFEHVIPMARGGSKGWSNIKLAHCRCNLWKRDRLPEELPALGFELGKQVATSINKEPK